MGTNINVHYTFVWNWLYVTSYNTTGKYGRKLHTSKFIWFDPCCNIILNGTIVQRYHSLSFRKTLCGNVALWPSCMSLVTWLSLNWCGQEIKEPQQDTPTLCKLTFIFNLGLCLYSVFSDIIGQKGGFLEPEWPGLETPGHAFVSSLMIGIEPRVWYRCSIIELWP